MLKHRPLESFNRGRRPSDAARAALLADARVIGGCMGETSLALEYARGHRVDVTTPDEARAKELGDRLGAAELSEHLECYRRERRMLLFRARSGSRPVAKMAPVLDLARPVPRAQRREARAARSAIPCSAGDGSDGPPPRRRVLVRVVYTAPAGRRLRRVAEVRLEALGACKPALERAAKGGAHA